MEEEIFLSDDEKNKANNSKDLSFDSAPQSLNKDLAQCGIKEKKRKWWIAGLLSLLVPGLGQFYNGQPKKGLWFYIFGCGYGFFFYLCISLVAIFSVNPFIFLFFYILFSVSLFIVAPFFIIEAIITARRGGEECQWERYNKYNKGYIYAGAIVISSVITIPIFIIMNDNVFGGEEVVNSNSMSPTLEVGEGVFVENLSYWFSKPSRGDIVLCQIPPKKISSKKEILLFKRIIGLPGETLKITNRQVFINNKSLKEPYTVYQNVDYPEIDHIKPIKIPKNHFFVMGDNRNKSLDSRLYGFLPRDKIRGRTRVIFWSWDSTKKRVRWERLGQRIN